MNGTSKFRDSISRINLPDNLGPDLKDNTGERAIQFSPLAKSTASLRISFSSVLRLRAASNCFMRFGASGNSEGGTTGSLVPTATN